MLRGGWEGNIILMVTYSGHRLVQLFFAKCSSQVLYNRFFFSSPMHAPPRRLDLNEMELLTVETAAECSFEWGKKTQSQWKEFGAALSLPPFLELVVVLRFLTWFHVSISAQRHCALMWETDCWLAQDGGVCSATFPVVSLRVAFKRVLLNATTCNKDVPGWKLVSSCCQCVHQSWQCCFWWAPPGKKMSWTKMRCAPEDLLLPASISTKPAAASRWWSN